MKKYISVLSGSLLFSGIADKDIEALLTCLDAHVREYKKGEYILRQGQTLDSIIILAKGSLHIQKDDYWGNRSILGQISPGEMFGEAYAAPDSPKVLNDVVAAEDSAAVFLDVKRIIVTCPRACPFHTAVVQNMFYAISEKNRQLVRKLSHMSKRTTREKLISYLSEQAKSKNSDMFEIPFNRQQLADFLSVDRSAMSGELCKMRDEGLIEFEKNRFRLLQSSFNNKSQKGD